MFSHVILNKFKVQKNYNVIPFGHRCTSAISCRYARLRKFALPFDWTTPTFPNKIQKVLENDFNEYIPVDIVENKNFTNKYDIKLMYFNENIKEGILDYTRRIERFREIMNNNNHKYFVYINEDYLYDPLYRKIKFSNKIFLEMLELELFLMKKYPNMKFNILYFDFVKYTIPAYSNIIMIKLTTREVYNNGMNTPFELLRYYCGDILCNFFNTEPDLNIRNNL